MHVTSSVLGESAYEKSFVSDITKCSMYYSKKFYRRANRLKFRLANKSDLPKLKKLYQELIVEMEKNNIKIWDDIYPCNVLEIDITNNRLYILLDNDQIVSTFSISDSHAGENDISWANPNSSALYIDRLAVNVQYLRQGMGSLTLQIAQKISKSFQAEYLRLFVVNINIPAIQLYLKNNFTQMNGIYREQIDDCCSLIEYGFETKL